MGICIQSAEGGMQKVTKRETERQVVGVVRLEVEEAVFVQIRVVQLRIVQSLAVLQRL
jgi:hypothetical protein